MNYQINKQNLSQGLMGQKGVMGPKGIRGDKGEQVYSTIVYTTNTVIVEYSFCVGK